MLADVDWNIAGRIAALVGRTEGPRAQNTDTDDETSPFARCLACEKSFMNADMQSCPECGGGLTRPAGDAETADQSATTD